MALQKQSVPINFSQGIETKTDPFQVPPGKFLSLQNAIFDRGGMLQKRNGYAALADLPDTSSNYATTFNGNLVAIGNTVEAYSQSTSTWINNGNFKPVKLSTLPLHRSNTNQSQVDSAIAANGLVCIAYTDNVVSMGSTVPAYYYAISNLSTGQNIIAPTLIPASVGAIAGSPRLFLLGNYFIIVTTTLSSGVYRLEFQAISTMNPSNTIAPVVVSASYVPATTVAFDGVVANNTLYLAWNSVGAIRMRRISTSLIQSNTVPFVGQVGTIFSLNADTTGNSPIIYASYYDSNTQIGHILAVDQNLGIVLTPTTIITAEDVANIAITAQNGSAQIFYEVNSTYGYDGAIETNYIKNRTCTQGGSLGSASVLVRSVGLASKAQLIDGVPYFLSIYQSTFQPSLFLINGNNGSVNSTLAYSNASSYYEVGLPNMVIDTLNAYVPYLIKDQIQAVNKTQGVTNAAGVYAQTGLNLAHFTLSSTVTTSSEIGGNLNLPGGFLWAYDGYSIVENGFFVWPDFVEVTGHTTGGTMTAQQYFYQVTYEWSDNQGNIFRSAPSVPVSVTTTGATSSVSINVPTLRLTHKTNNPVKIVAYRWSTGQQTYYQVTSVTVPTLNNLTVDYVTITDTLPDSSILGNNILYTTGGVLENIAPPAVDTSTLFQSRLFTVTAEDKNLLRFSKQVIQNTPVEMSDLLTIYIAPTISAQGSTGGISALSAMDDKLIIFKQEAIYYITGQGPDNTGANSTYSDPVFITGTVGSVNQRSIILIPDGLMFQSDKGIWLLGRDLSTSYIGAPAQQYTQNALVKSSINIPGTNQVRFTMDSGFTLMYDYYYKQWGVFTNIPALASTLYQNLHTYINSLGQVFQESQGEYLDGTHPVLLSFTTSWLNLAGLQGYERAYFFYLLGVYISPHKLAVSIAYDYNSSPTQVSVISPDNFNPSWGGLAQWGSSPSWGGNPSREQWRVFLRQQKCQAFQVSIQEVYDSTLGAPAGAGLTLSGLDLVVGMKSGYPRLKSSNSVG